jgi:hypothetical protein
VAILATAQLSLTIFCDTHSSTLQYQVIVLLFIDLPLAPAALVLNGQAMMVAGGEVTVTKPQSAGSSTGAIPKSISFDKTAERGDKVETLF